MNNKKQHINFLKPIIYKEWLKSRVAIIASIIVCISATSYVFLSIKHETSASSGKIITYWYNILFLDLNYIHILKYIPLLIGISIACSQCIPEVINKRLKLSLHLPANENRIISYMLISGILFLTLVFAIFISYLFIINSIWFPAEITSLALISSYTWILAGYCSYFLSVLIIYEPHWLFRLIYSLVACIILSIFFIHGKIGSTSIINPELTVLTILCGITPLFSSYRLRKGMQ